MKTSRRELVEWLRDLGININKIEEIGQGTAICKLLNLIHPNVSFNYVKNPSSNYEYLKNLKVAQSFFAENKIDVRFPIEKLVQCKLQDNIEFAQWLYKYFIKNYKQIKKNNEESIILNNEESVREKNRQEIIENIKKHNEDHNVKLEDKYNLVLEENKRLINVIRNQELELATLKSQKSQIKNEELQKLMSDLEKNRDFYFSILVDIEKFLIEYSNIEKNVKEEILSLLYRKE
ncbi:microtubule-associated protein RP/EB family member/BIM1-like [Vairimorpha necatrix]|uniref:Microtubule-associated protein RP/EB family member/BIM1-like n=1 Tax=Vairimorpha necatrix TaxID=6039 RepID=A0AAX4JFR8_9MICR